MNYLLAAGGLILLFAGGESLVRGAVGLARRLDVSPLFTGLVVVGFGTSAPEFVVCLEAALRGQDDITIGNIVGSNIANIMLIMGIAALIQPVISRASILRRDGTAMLMSSVILIAIAYFGEVSQTLAVVMLLVLVAFIVSCYLSERQQSSAQPSSAEQEVEDLGRLPSSVWMSLLASGVGVGALVFGSHLLIDGATRIALSYGFSQAAIGVTLVAVGTSLPELAAAFVAALRKHADVALGNVLGSNVFNVFGMLGLTALIEPVTVSPVFLHLDMWVMLGVSVLLLIFLTTGNRLSRTESLILLFGYGGYVVFLLQPGRMPIPI